MIETVFLGTSRGSVFLNTVRSDAASTTLLSNTLLKVASDLEKILKTTSLFYLRKHANLKIKKEKIDGSFETIEYSSITNASEDGRPTELVRLSAA